MKREKKEITDNNMVNSEKLNELIGIIEEQQTQIDMLKIQLMALENHYVTELAELKNISEEEIEDGLEVFVNTFAKAFEEGKFD